MCPSTQDVWPQLEPGLLHASYFVWTNIQHRERLRGFLQPVTIIKGSALNYSIEYVCLSLFSVSPLMRHRKSEGKSPAGQREGNKQQLICSDARMNVEIPVCRSKLLSVRELHSDFFYWTFSLCCWCAGTDILKAWKFFRHEKAQTSKGSSKNRRDRSKLLPVVEFKGIQKWWGGFKFKMER